MQKINNIEIVKNNNFWEKINDLNLEKTDKRNIRELLLDLKDKEDDIIIQEDNVEYIKNKVKECIMYLNIFEKILENNDEKSKDNLNIVNEDDYNQISYIVSQLEPILENNEIINIINSDIDKKYNINSLAQLLEVQLALSDKIRELIK